MRFSSVLLCSLWVSFAACGPPSVALPAATHQGAVMGSSANDLWLATCSGNAEGPAHWNGSSWKALSIAQAPCSRATTFTYAAAGANAVWYVDNALLMRLHADGTVEDFSSKLPMGVSATHVASHGDQAVVFFRVMQAGGAITQEAALLEGTSFTALPRLPLFVDASGTMRSPTDIWANVEVNQNPNPQVSSNLLHWDGTAWTQLPLEGIAGLDWVRSIDRSFSSGDLWARSQSPDGLDGLSFYRWDGAHWHGETLPFPSTPKMPAGVAGHDLSFSFIARSLSGKLAAFAVYSPVDTSGANQPISMPGGELGIDSTYWAVEWDGAKWTRATELATVIRCIGPNCGSATGYMEGGELDDGTVVIGNGSTEASAMLLLRY
jgi:hypothetical protein